MMMRYEPMWPRMSERAGRAALICALALAAGCQTMTGPTASPPPPPPTQLLDAARLELPKDCAVPSGRTYRMSFVVGTDGRTSGGMITPPDGPPCLQDALASWIATFRYARLGQPEPVTADWVLVTARRGS